MAGADTQITVDPHGDVLLLIAGEKQRTLQVSSKVMSLASPVWRTMLDPRGPFREANPDNGAISFLEDDPEALLILLLAAHLKYQEIPEEMSYELLWNVCITCDKYDCIEIVRPWLLKWLAPLKHLVEENGFEGFLFISWVIGDRDMFEGVSRKIALECSTNTRMECLTACGEVLGEKLPPAAVDGILETRLKTLAKLVQACHSEVNFYGPARSDNRCRAGCKANDCDVLVFGSLAQNLLSEKLWPGKPTELVSTLSGTSVKRLSDQILAFKCSQYPASGYPHDKCGFVSRFSEAVRIIVGSMPSGMLNSHKKHLKIQHGKLNQPNTLLKRLQAPTASSPRSSKRGKGDT